MSSPLEAPFPYPGVKSNISEEVWERLGDPKHYIEPFAGSAAVFLDRPGAPPPPNHEETLNDKDGHITNVWRSIKMDPEGVLDHLSWPTSEIDLHARRDWLQERTDDLESDLRDDHEYCDPKAAAFWIWGKCLWIGGSWPHDDGQSMPSLSRHGKGIKSLKHRNSKDQIINALSDRLSDVRILNGGWNRPMNTEYIMKSAGTPVAIYLDPPYPDETIESNFYSDNLTDEGIESLWSDILDWCRKWGDDSEMRIALSGHSGYGVSDILTGWEEMEWERLSPGFSAVSGGKSDDADRERLWFSPHCRDPESGLIDMFS